MTYCLLPGCLQPQNSDQAKHCQTCGTKLWLKDRYRPVRLLGQGGFGRTFWAIDEDLPSHPSCVIKQLCLQNFYAGSISKATQMFYQEAEQLDRLGAHAQIPKLLAYCEQNRLLYLVQECIEGQDLKQELQTSGPFSEAKIWDLLAGLLPVLKFLHQQNIVHRDLKPANMMRRSQDNALILIDFGIAKLIDPEQLTRTGTVVGSMEYMAPEQQRGKCYPASDLYSLGVTCLYLLTGESPLAMYDDRRDRWQWQTRVPAETGLSAALTSVLDKLVCPSLPQRYQSAQEVLLDVQRHQRVQPARSPQTSRPLPAPALVVTSPPPVKIHYGALQKALAAGQWEQADQATHQILCTAAQRPVEQGITADDVSQIPCAVWEKLDWLWTRYSRNRFGFSPQVQLFVLVGEDYHRFCAQVGWPTHQAITPYLQFSRKAPSGHLPSRQWASGYHWWQHMQWVSDRLKSCQLL